MTKSGVDKNKSDFVRMTTKMTTTMQLSSYKTKTMTAIGNSDENRGQWDYTSHVTHHHATNSTHLPSFSSLLLLLLLLLNTDVALVLQHTLTRLSRGFQTTATAL